MKPILLFLISINFLSTLNGQITGTQVGQFAPEINGISPTGKQTPLTNLNGTLVLINFWSSKCRAYRHENLNLVNVWNK